MYRVRQKFNNSERKPAVERIDKGGDSGMSEYAISGSGTDLSDCFLVDSSGPTNQLIDESSRRDRASTISCGVPTGGTPEVTVLPRGRERGFVVMLV